MKNARSEIKLKPGDKLQVHVDRLAIGGRGVARHEGLVIFISDTAPDEDVEVELTFVKKNFAEARLLSVTKPSPFRRKPPCPVAGICGGCSWQHVTYEQQLEQKKQLVSEALRRMSGFETDVARAVASVIPSPNELRYRNRIQLHHAGPKMGFFKRASHDIVDINDCPITEHAIADEIPALKKRFAGEKAGRIEALLNREGNLKIRTVEGALRKLIPTAEPEAASDTTGPAFSQVNTAQNTALVEAVVKVAVETLGKSRGQQVIYDLYAGSGNFTFPLAKALPRASIIAAELGEESVRMAQDRLDREQSNLNTATGNIDFRRVDVGVFLDEEPIADGAVIVLDPPRSGCEPRVMKALSEQRPARIVYVSCHPVTLARDLRILKDAGFVLDRVQPFDMFPQTDHVETLAILSLP